MARTTSRQKLGKSIKQLRTEAGFTQETLGEVTGLDRTYISGIERGVRNPTITIIETVAKALNVKVADLITF